MVSTGLPYKTPLPDGTPAERAERVAEAARNAKNSMHLARAVLGDQVVLNIIRQYQGWPDNADTRARIIDDIRAAMAAKTRGVFNGS